jgi:class 3 adenylate cyclase
MSRSPVPFFNRLSIQSKLLLTFLLTSLISMLIAGYIGYSGGKQALETSILNTLTATRVKQADTVQSYFKFTENHVLTLSESPFIVQAFKEFNAGYQKLATAKLTPAQQNQLKTFYQKDYIPQISRVFDGSPLVETYLPTTPAAQYLQYHYIAANSPASAQKRELDNANDGSDYSRTHQKYNPIFRGIADRFGYEDILLVDRPSGNIIYSLAKDPDYVTNLRSGPYATTNLANAFEQAISSKDPNFVTSVDFESYRPARGKPVAFFPTTLFDDNKEFLGALIFQAPTNRINQVMTFDRKWEEVGLGKSGETYLAGLDNSLRTVPRAFVTQPDAYYEALRKFRGADDKTIDRIRQTGTPILLHKVKNEAVQNALTGSEGSLAYTDYLGNSVLGSYQPVRLGGFRWALVVKQNVEEALAPVRELTRRILVTAGILIPLVTLLGSWFARNLVRPIRDLRDTTRRIADGETDAKVEITTKDEFRELGTSFNNMSHNLSVKEEMLEDKIRENDRLLLNILPAPVVQRLKAGDTLSTDNFTNVSVLYAEVDDFSELTAKITPERSAALLNELVSTFDETAERFGVEKLRTVGFAYLAVCGLSIARIDHAKRTVDFARQMLNIVARFNQKYRINLSLDIGIHSGPVVGGIVGKSKFIYELWGDTMTIARAVHGSPDRNVIQITEPVYKALESLYTFEALAPVQLKNQQSVPVWLVKSSTQATQPPTQTQADKELAQSKQEKPSTQSVQSSAPTQTGEKFIAAEQENPSTHSAQPSTQSVS